MFLNVLIHLNHCRIFACAWIKFSPIRNIFFEGKISALLTRINFFYYFTLSLRELHFIRLILHQHGITQIAQTFFIQFFNRCHLYKNILSSFLIFIITDSISFFSQTKCIYFYNSQIGQKIQIFSSKTKQLYRHLGEKRE